MSIGVPMKDLVVGVPDNDIKAIMERLLQEKNLNFTIIRIPNGDSGCRFSAADILRSYHTDYNHALLIFDLEGSGGINRVQIETEVEQKFKINGWPGTSAAAVVIDPEIEEWIWGLAAVLPNWVREVLRKTGKDKRRFKAEISRKRPRLPKRATSQWYGEWAAKLPGNCQDPAFQKLMTTLQRWFP